MTQASITTDGAGARPALTLPQRVILAEGWTRRGIAFLAGACGALALAPIDFAPAMAVPMCAAVWLLDGAAAARGAGALSFARGSMLSAAAAGWWLGFGYFLAGLWWLGAALLVQADQFAWALPLAVIGVPAGLACFTALGFALARLLWTPGSLRVFALAAGLSASEWLRGHVMTGFPWNDVGMALASVPVLDQTAALVGLHGLDILAVILFAAPATLADGGRRRMTPAILVALILTAAMGVYGGLRLLRGESGFVDGVTLRLMQPNLPQDAKFKPENGGEILRRYLELTDRAIAPGHSGVADVTHVIWPESAFPFILSREPQAMARIAATLQNATLLTGAARVEDAPGGARRTKIFNAILALQRGRIVAAYDKIHLVPFGEYLPLAGLLGPLGATHLVPGVWDAGAGPRRLRAPGLPLAAPLVCYEAIFPGETVEPDGPERPQFLLNVTNDGWFGATSGPYQHFAQARLRAIEEGLPLVRAANTGVSAIVDPYGRILGALPLGVEDVLDGRLPKPASPPPFALHPFLWTSTLWFFTIIFAALGRVRGFAGLT
ncbi:MULTISPECIES: apolipoprotein N-acyltransferase [Methylosinus]|uniref:Apolipoprotein N-acyltransferase n=1 Tax=Methylosinus trichosporium (strain ATCC 35070 / NCIMB 11131 / UNIQEM 75 / OB3b) TaxID=595536 RepID=A0A2D2CX39_METT3|nr:MULTISPECIES: apolipoprotein N-acyltransferase [Methylosinus]ATQ67293.1 apolipoprotein N-acyltransferase [Methylosinus trichosporium OB3b]OBS52085.1 apolipoprotein N-acyltransferase [Methylosinus sp. 3S-1]